MYTDIPVFKRCCFCFPLRPGLIAWNYLKLVTSLLFLGFISYFLHIYSELMWITEGSTILLCFTIFFVVLDIIFVIIFLVSAHMKKHNMMKIYYKYCVAMLALHVLSAFVILFYTVLVASHFASRRFIGEFLLTYIGLVIFMFFEIILLVYMILLVKSEVIKLESSFQVRIDMSACAGDGAIAENETHTAFCNRLVIEPEHVDEEP